jgi:hypothetical protein
MSRKPYQIAFGEPEQTTLGGGVEPLGMVADDHAAKVAAPDAHPEGTTAPVPDPCQSCGVSTAPGSGRFVNRIPADDGWGCALCFEPCGFEDAKGYTCHGCNPEGLEDAGHGAWPVYADDIETRETCQHCGAILHDWDGIERGQA